MMHTIIFETTIKDGVIELPPEHRVHAGSVVRVIIVEASPETAPDMIDQLLANPIDAPGFSPMARDALHDRGH